MRALFNPQEKRLLKGILASAKNKKIKLYLVGGILRDYFLKRKKVNPDIDFCLKEGSIKFGRFLSGKLAAGFVVLDREHGACRLVKELNGRTYTLDFTDFRAHSLEQDLLHRDFTFNALAIELENIFVQNGLGRFLIDPYSGRMDLAKKKIWPVGKNAFDEDPLRILRAFSFACVLGFKIDPESLRLIKAKKDKLLQVSGERIRDELFKMLQAHNTYAYFDRMDKLGVLEIILPEIKFMRNVRQGPYHHLDVWQHNLETLRQVEIAMTQCARNRKIAAYLDESISGDRRRLALIKLGALLHDIGKPKARRRLGIKIIFHGHERVGLDFVIDIAARLKLSNDEMAALKKMVLWHLRPGFLADNHPVSRRAIFRYFRDTAEEAVSVLLVSLADQRSTRGPLTTRQSRSQHEKLVSILLKEYFRRQEEQAPPRLIDGNDLMKKFDLQPSPLVGRILREIEELQAIGKIKTAQDAYKAADKFLKK